LDQAVGVNWLISVILAAVDESNAAVLIQFLMYPCHHDFRTRWQKLDVDRQPHTGIRSYLRTSPGMTRNSNIIGRNVARFRYQKGWSQDLLVTKMQLLGIYITRDILANIETLRTTATDKQIVVFAEVFGVPVGDLFPPKQKSSARIVGLNS
jgi:hypothetical protein